MTPKEGAKLAQELWEKAQREAGWNDADRMSFICGVCYALDHAANSGEGRAATAPTE